ncbi:choline dehydrogenase-like flavoprotein [Bradyrhizobium sp. i1.7.7]
MQSANRGLPRDYDEWRDLGARGWGWADVLPYFLKLETDLDFDGPLHGKHGPIPIRRIAREAMPPFGHAVGEALSATGLPFRKDQNGEFEDGIFPPAFSNRNDRRVSTATGYLDAATRARPNLIIWADSEVEQLQLDGRRATGVVVARGGQKLAVAAGRVILTAGALQSPAILMRAGIGPGAALQALGIPVAIDLPGVGSNLRDHPALTFCQYLPRRLRLPLARRRPNFAAMRFSSGHQGCDASDMYITASARGGWHALGTRLGLYFLWCNRPYSSGSLTLATPDPRTYPVVDLNLLSDDRDLERMVASVRLLAKLIVHSALNPEAADFFPAFLFPAHQAAEPVWHGQPNRRLHPRPDARRARGPQAALDPPCAAQRHGLPGDAGGRPRAGSLRATERVRRLAPRGDMPHGRSIRPESGGRPGRAGDRQRQYLRGGCFDHAAAADGQYQHSRDHGGREDQ